MKEIIAILQMNAMNRTKRALAEAGITSMTAKEALGNGSGIIDNAILNGAEEGFEEAIDLLGKRPRLYPKRVMFIVVPDNLKELVVKTIIKANRVSVSGCGKIFVLPMLEATRIRTGEDSDKVLDEA
jgi:nitrogen regulatory protein PII 2